MKKNKIMLFLTIGFLVLTIACGNRVEDKKETDSETIQSQTETADTAEITAEATGETMAVSNVKSTIPYIGDDFTKSVFVAGSDEIYICGLKPEGTYFLGQMKAEGNNLTELPIEIPKNQKITNMTVDNNGNCHILWMSVEKNSINGVATNHLTFDKSYITVINSAGETENTIDVTDIFKNEQIMPYCFITDYSGNYYFENTDEIIELDQDGKQIIRIQCDGRITTLGEGKSGAIYCTYMNEDDIEELGTVKDEAFISCGVTLPEVGPTSTCLCPGTDTELLIFNYEGGVYSYEATANIIDIRVPISELTVKGQDVAGYGFLSDGRLCLLGQTLDSTVFYYIPAGR